MTLGLIHSKLIIDNKNANQVATKSSIIININYDPIIKCLIKLESNQICDKEHNHNVSIIK